MEPTAAKSLIQEYSKTIDTQRLGGRHVVPFTQSQISRRNSAVSLFADKEQRALNNNLQQKSRLCRGPCSARDECLLCPSPLASVARGCSSRHDEHGIWHLSADLDRYGASALMAVTPSLAKPPFQYSHRQNTAPRVVGVL